MWMYIECNVGVRICTSSYIGRKYSFGINFAVKKMSYAISWVIQTETFNYIWVWRKHTIFIPYALKSRILFHSLFWSSWINIIFFVYLIKCIYFLCWFYQLNVIKMRSCSVVEGAFADHGDLYGRKINYFVGIWEHLRKIVIQFKTCEKYDCKLCERYDLKITNVYFNGSKKVIFLCWL